MHLCQPMRRMTLGGVRSWSMIASRRTPPSHGHCRGSEKPWPSLRLNGTARGLTTCWFNVLGAGVGRGNGVAAACAGAGEPVRSCQATSHAGRSVAAVIAPAPRCRPHPIVSNKAPQSGSRANQARPSPFRRRPTLRTGQTSRTPAQWATTRARGQPRYA